MKLAGNSAVKWFCTRVDCSAKSPISNLLEVLNSLVAKVDDLAAKVNKLEDVPDDTKSLKSELKIIQEKCLPLKHVSSL